MTPTPADLLARTLRGDASWAASCDWNDDAIVRSAAHHGVTTLVWRALQDQDGAVTRLTARLAPMATAEVARTAVLEHELAAVLRAFEAHGVQALLMKGAALAYSCYPDPWLRRRTDTDVLIERSAFERAAEALASLGYAPTSAISTGEFVSHQTAFERRDVHGLVHAVDVHWKAVNPQVLSDAVPFRDVWNDARQVTIAGVTARVPDEAWSLIVACVHRLAHHQDQERLGWLYDIHLLARRLGAEDWQRVVAIARARRVGAVCEDGLEAAARYLGTSLPAAVLETLRHAGVGDPSRRYTEGEQRRLTVLRDDLRHLATWRDRMRLLREHAFPPASFMLARYSSRQRAWLPALYLHRLVTGAWKWMRA
jgi:hypothetical protein